MLTNTPKLSVHQARIFKSSVQESTPTLSDCDKVKHK